MKKNIIVTGLMLALGVTLALSGSAFAEKCTCPAGTCDCHCTQPCCAGHKKDACQCKECAKDNHCHCTKDCCKGHQPKDVK